MLDAFNRYLTQPVEELSEADLDALNIAFDRAEEFVVAPQEFANVLMQYPFMLRDYCMRFKVSAPGEQPPNIPLQDTYSGGSEGDRHRFGKRNFHLHEVSGRVKISRSIFEKGKTSPCEVVADRLAYWLREAEEEEFVVGTGSDECTGLFTPSEMGISTARDFISAHKSFVTGDDFKDALMMLEPQYRAKARWILHLDTVRLAQTLTDSQGQPIYEEATASQTPTIAGAPYIMTGDAPNKIATGQYIAVLGDLSWYGVAETMEFEVHATVEPDRAIKKNTYTGHTYVDGMPLREEAFVRLKIA